MLLLDWLTWVRCGWLKGRRRIPLSRRPRLQRPVQIEALEPRRLLTITPVGDDFYSAYSLSHSPGTTQTLTAAIGDEGRGVVDVDMFRIDLNAGESLTVDVDAVAQDGGGSLTSTDLALRVFDDYGSQIASNDDGVDPETGMNGDDPAWTFEASWSGTYYIGISRNDHVYYDPWYAGSGTGSGGGSGYGSGSGSGGIAAEYDFYWTLESATNGGGSGSGSGGYGSGSGSGSGGGGPSSGSGSGGSGYGSGSGGGGAPWVGEFDGSQILNAQAHFVVSFQTEDWSYAHHPGIFSRKYSYLGPVTLGSLEHAPVEGNYPEYNFEQTVSDYDWTSTPGPDVSTYLWGVPLYTDASTDWAVFFSPWIAQAREHANQAANQFGAHALEFDTTVTSSATSSFYWFTEVDANHTWSFTGHYVNTSELGDARASAVVFLTGDLIVPNQAPVFSPDTYQFNVSSSSSVGDMIGVLNSSDPDGDFLYYSDTPFNGGGAMGALGVDVNGQLFINDPSQLVPGQTITQDFWVFDRSDGTGLSDIATVTLVVDELQNDAPVFSPDYYDIYVPAGASFGTYLGVITATDPNGDVLTFSEDTMGSAYQTDFLIDPNTGTLSLGSFELPGGSAVIERTYWVRDRLDAYSSQTLWDSATVRFHVTSPNQPPQFLEAPYYFTISDASISNQQIGTVTAFDPDPGDIITYGFMSGLVATSGTYWIDSATGVISVTGLSPESGYLNVVVTAMDQHGGIDYANVSVEIYGNAHPQFINDPYYFFVPNTTSIGQIVGTATAIDPDMGDTVTYAITAHEGPAPADFSIDAVTGEITITALPTADAWHTLTVTATDSHGATATTIVNLEVAGPQPNSLPEFRSEWGGTTSYYWFEIPGEYSDQGYNSPYYLQVGQLYAHDYDADPLEFQLLNPPAGLPFELDPMTGVLRYTDTTASVWDQWVFNVLVHDGRGGTDTAQVTVDVDEPIIYPPDYAPNFQQESYQFQITADAVNGTAVGVLTAYDPDGPDPVSYRWSAGASAPFAIIR